jgi:hypothetical protein
MIVAQVVDVSPFSERTPLATALGTPPYSLPLLLPFVAPQIILVVHSLIELGVLESCVDF